MHQDCGVFYRLFVFFQKSQRMQSAACNVIAALALRNVPACTLLVENEAPEAIVRAMKLHANVGNVQVRFTSSKRKKKSVHKIKKIIIIIGVCTSCQKKNAHLKTFFEFLTFDSWNRFGGTKNCLPSSVAHFVDLSRQNVEYKIYAFPSNMPAAKCPLFLSVQN